MSPTFPGYFLDGGLLPTSTPVIAHLQGGAPLNVDALLLGSVSRDGTSEYYGTAPFANERYALRRRLPSAS